MLKTKKGIFMVIILVLCILTVMRIGWLNYFKQEDAPVAENGVIDLRDETFNDTRTIPLDGDWLFIPDEYVDQPTFEQRIKEGSVKSIHVPGNWAGQLHGGNGHSPIGKGTYYLKLKLPKNNIKMYGIYMKRIKTASNIYADNKKIMTYGNFSGNPYQNREKFSIDYALFHTGNEEVSFIFHVENTGSPTSGGLKESIFMGSKAAVVKKYNFPVTTQLIVAAILLMHALYSLGVYLLGGKKGKKELLYFALLLLSSGATLLIDENSLFSMPISYSNYQRMFGFLFASSLITILLFLEHLFSIKAIINTVSKVVFSIYMILYIFGSLSILPYLSLAGMWLNFYTVLVLIYYAYKVLPKVKGYSIFILIFIVAYSSNSLWRMAVKLNWTDMPFYPIDFMIAIIAIGFILIQQYIQVSRVNEAQTSELQKMDKARDEFLATTSHELRNPLHGIINIADTVLKHEDKQLSQEGKYNLRLLSDIGKKMGYTLNDLSTITQLRENSVQLSYACVNLHTAAGFVIDMLEFMKEGKHITLYSKVPADFPKLYADENRVIQILFNLVHNAIKYTISGTIHIDAEVKYGHAHIYVKDTGMGIDSQKAKQIFDPYVRLNENLASSGIGIGLSISKKLVELHGGEISLVPNEDGTTFVFTMPLSMLNEQTEKSNMPNKRQNQPLEKDKNSAALLEPPSGTILIVDDDAVNLKVFEQLLNDEYHVLTATDPREVLTMIHLHTVDVILTDIMMPVMSGYKLTKEIRKRYAISELPIIHITARNTPEDIQLSFQSGANDYLVKPVNSAELRIRLNALMHLKHYIKESRKFEAAWLQAQIQPHFLFNTLTAIAALAEMDTDRMNTLLHAFGNYLQKSFSTINLQATVPIQHEIELANAYITIEQERFGDRLHMEYEFDNDIDITIPPLSIQPLIENAINHGIMGKVEGGTITWKIKKHAEYIEVIVQDNGVGMSKQRIKDILDVSQNARSGVGVNNTDKRLLHLYNRGLQIQSKENEGTIISFQIPS